VWPSHPSSSLLEVMLELAVQLLVQRRMLGRDGMVSGNIRLSLVERLVVDNRGTVCILKLHTNLN
jgi:hypothetical protein